MAENIQALIDLLGDQILNHDLGHIKGEEIVNGNPEHCINLLQLVHEFSVVIQKRGGVGSSNIMDPNASSQNMGDGDQAIGGASSQKKNQPKQMFLNDEDEDQNHP